MTGDMNSMRIGADVGGTFTDVVLMDGAGRVWTHKIPSTPPDFEQAVLTAIRQMVAGRDVRVSEVAHGTTVATNAVLEQRGARTALITTRGFRDVLELRRIRAPQMYDLFWDKPAPLVERYLRFEVTERIAADGAVITPLAEAELADIKAQLERAQIEAVAVCFLHAYAYPRHELLVGEFLRRELPAVQVSLSHEVLRERKEYERTATTVVNAYVRPVMQRYLDALRDGLRAMQIDAPLLIMQSAGGLTPAEDAALRPVYVLESGPAAGVFAASHIARSLNIANVITLDIGGTTAKTSLIEDGRIAYSAQYEVGASLSAGNRLVGGGGELIRAPSIDIAEVGAGGGSIAFLDRAGGLRVGPRSAGAMPGPACYQRGGTQPTVTDANVVLGYIRPGKLADGVVSVDAEAAQRAIHDRIARPMGIGVLEAAEGIHRIANARTMRALRSVSTERGRDPRQFTLMAFGGSGPIHAAGLARELFIRQVIVPPMPGLFSALGLLFAGVEHHDVRSCLLTIEGGPPARLHSANTLSGLRDEMLTAMLAQFAREGFAADQVVWQCSVDARFQGQASAVRLLLDVTGGTTEAQLREPFGDGTLSALQTAFMSEHKRLYGHADADTPVEVIAVRLVGNAGMEGNAGARLVLARNGQAAEGQPQGLPLQARRAYFGAQHGVIATPVIARAGIAGVMRGPLLIDEYDSTTVVPPAVTARLDEQGNIVLSIES